MKRDDDLIRDLLVRLEQVDEWLHMMPGTTSGASEEEWRERYHLELMGDVGFVTGVGDGTFRLTAQGHDYLEAIRDEGIWKRTKAAVAETGGNATLEIIKRIANRLLEKQLEKYLGDEK